MRALVLVALAACGDNTFGFTPATLHSGAASLELAGDGSALVLARDGNTLLTFAATAFQVGTVDDLDSGASFDPYWLFVDAPPQPPAGLAWHAADRLVLAAASESELVIAAGDALVTFTAPRADAFAATMTSTAPRAAYLRLAPDAGASEGFYGLGEWPDAVDHRGTLRPMQMEVDPASESSDDENHVPVPLVVGTNGWGLFVASDRPGAFDVARQSATRVDVAFGTAGDDLAFHLFAPAAALDVYARYYDVAGAPGLPAPWATGPLLWRNDTASQAQLVDDIAQIRSRKLAATGVWLDHPYATGVETFDFAAAKFTDPAAMFAALHDAGLRYGLWHVPYTAPSSNGDPAQPELDYATAHDFFPPTTAILLNSWGKPIDFSNADAYAWWQSNLRTYTDGFGVEGWKLDYGEDVVVGLAGQRSPWLFADGSDERTMHYRYQRLYHAAYRELLAPDGAFMLVRTGRWGDQTIGAIVWPGDLDASFARAGDALPGMTARAVGGLPAAVTKGINLSASGFPFYASDTGGYRHAPADDETWIRWMEANAVWPALEVGDASSIMPWERSPQALAAYARYANLHLRLFPYSWSYARAIATTGRPIVRPLGLAYPSLGVHPTDEWLLGDGILVAPVVAAGQTTRDVVLPPGVWFDWWTGMGYAGGAVTVAADLDTLPLFIQAGAIVPMLRPTIETLAPVATGSTIDSFATDPGALWVRVVEGPEPTRFVMYDGTVLTKGLGTLSYTPGSTFAEGAVFEFIAVGAPPSSVTVAGVPLAQRTSLAALVAAGDGWFFDLAATGGTLWIAVGGAAAIELRF